ncbi:MAG: NADH-quinone oxidoreductase subunit C [Verrucomicrobiota bacterium]|jgi:NADH-quinone oxidoreductase subunit C
MQTLQQLKPRIEAAIQGVSLEIIPNGSPANPPSLLVDRPHGRAVAEWLRDDPETRLDYASNVTGVDWPEKTVKEKTRVRKSIQGLDKEVEEIVEKKTPGFLEAVYHLYSMALKHGPLVLRLRTENRSDRAALPSLTPVWRSCELQEREVFDLFGIQFQGHPDLRRILMWDGFADFPMRKDYVPPADDDPGRPNP